jgi:hypothetical protein
LKSIAEISFKVKNAPEKDRKRRRSRIFRFLGLFGRPAAPAFSNILVPKHGFGATMESRRVFGA